MATLKELIDEHGFGVKFKSVSKDFKVVFTPIFIDKCNDAYGKTDREVGAYYGAYFNEWELYVEPKKKVKKYLGYNFRTGCINSFHNLDEIKNHKTLMCDGKPVYIEVEE